ncbi:ABC transporter ATP-binding protein [Arcanobacterium hippocoleae]|uniref:ABC transporter ATP-binding protein n=1 Tax=Arcanobacterium hippocoleae TaxID=149017 RepID=UPI00333F3312
MSLETKRKICSKMGVLAVTNVLVRRSGKEILQNVNWSVNEGERWVIFGPNGAGKTTLVQLISGYLHPTSGSVEVLGEKIGKVNIAELRPLIGLASAALDQKIPGNALVFDVVRTAAYGQTATWREEYEETDDARAMQLLQSLGVDQLAKRKYASLSSGEMKRVAIARALMPNPEILILDEPAAGLDLGGREQLLTALTTLAKDPSAPAMVLVTHHVEEIPAGFTHGLLLQAGEVFANGTLDEVFTAENISNLFQLPMEINFVRERFYANAKTS